MPKNDLQNYLLTYTGHFSGVFSGKKETLVKYVINQIHRFNFLAVNDFCVYLHGHVGMSEQLAGGIKVGTEGKHHGGESVAAGVVVSFFSGANLIPPTGIYDFYCVYFPLFSLHWLMTRKLLRKQNL